MPSPETSTSQYPASGAVWVAGRTGRLEDFCTLAERLREPARAICVVSDHGNAMLAQGGTLCLDATGVAGEATGAAGAAYPLLAWVAPLSARQLGDAGFLSCHGVAWPYMAGSMANGIASVEMVQALARAGMLSSFGAAGLEIAELEAALERLQRLLPDACFASNLIHSPQQPDKEEAVVDLYLRRGLRLVETSAYIRLTPAVVRYRVSGIRQDADGEVCAPNRVIAKASRLEVAQRWFSPPPEDMLRALVAQGVISAQQAMWAERIPMAEDLTAEADSGGHTDNRPALVLMPAMIALRDRMQDKYRYRRPLRVGAAGGIATPMSAAGAFAMGAAYIVTGTINQACQEAGTSELVRQMLAQAEQADVMMAPAVDMFEMGVKLQVLKRGTLFAMRANRLWELYREYESLEALPAEERGKLERDILRLPLHRVWHETREFFGRHDPAQLEKAEADPKYRMSLVFRWYLGLSSHWANAGLAERQADYQIWAGPAIGAFNEWCRGSFLESVGQRHVVEVARNILSGAAIQTRINSLLQQGIRLDQSWCRIAPVAHAHV